LIWANDDNAAPMMASSIANRRYMAVICFITALITAKVEENTRNSNELSKN